MDLTDGGHLDGVVIGISKEEDKRKGFITKTIIHSNAEKGNGQNVRNNYVRDNFVQKHCL